MPSCRRRILLVLTLFLACGALLASELTVSAAVSLSEPFNEISRRYEAANPGTKIWLNTGASGMLLRQVENGAPVDVVAFADVDTMTSATESGAVSSGASTTFAMNRLVLITPQDSRLHLRSLSDLTTSAVRQIAIGNPDSVPAGRYAMHALQAQGLWLHLQPKLTYCENVRQALTYVAQGEVDAGLVYVTDARLVAGRVRVCTDVPTSAPVQYTIAPTRAAKNPAAARAFIAWVLSPPAQAILSRYGFHAPK